jgi:hypothetical protein
MVYCHNKQKTIAEVNKQKKSTLLLDNILEIIEAVIGGMLLIHDASRLSLK